MASPILVSAMTQILGSNATFTYGIGAAGAYGKLAIGGNDGLPYNNSSGNLLGTTLLFGTTPSTGFAPLASPTFTGVPASPTAAPGTNTTQLATTAFVTAAVAGGGAVSSVFARTGAVVAAGGDYTAAQVTNAFSTAASNTLADATNIAVGTTTGTKIGTATTQKLGFFNATPIVQPTGAALTALSNLGLIASPTLASTDVGLGNVTNNAQTQAAVVPNTVPTAGQLHVGNAGGTAFGVVSLSGSGATFSLASTGVLTVSAIAAASITTGTSGANIGLLNGANTYSGASTFSAAVTASAAGTASTPGLTVTGVPFAGTGTTSFPQLYVNSNAATASTTLTTTGTMLGVNGHAGAGDLLQLMQDGVSKFRVQSGGAISVTGGSMTFSDTLGITNATPSNAQILLNNAGIAASRNIADANPAMTITQTNASSTGDILRLANSGGNQFVVSQAGVITTATGTTQSALDNTTKLATTAYVNTEMTAVYQTSAPTTGGTVTPTFPQMISHYLVNPAGTLANLTLTLNTGTISGQIIFVTFNQIITALSVTSTNIGAVGMASPSAATATSCFGWIYNSGTSKWNRFL